VKKKNNVCFAKESKTSNDVHLSIKVIFTTPEGNLQCERKNPLINNKMLKYINKLKIPNVVEFYLKDKSIDNFALFVFEILRNQGSRFVGLSKTKRISKSNDYLQYQFVRLFKYAKNGELEKFNYLARKLLTKSKVFRVYALGYIFPKYNQMNTCKLQSLYNKVRKLCITESTDLQYKRVWIDKKEGDYGRPLGVPTPEWRVYGHMLTRILEVYFDGRGYLTSNQHGGKSGYGVMTYLKELAKWLKVNKYILEFDIKGFFDHITHESMLELIEGCYLKDTFARLLKARPISYKLPPVEEDLAIQRITALPIIEEETIIISPEQFEQYMENLTKYPDTAAKEFCDILGLDYDKEYEILVATPEEVLHYENLFQQELKNVRSEYSNAMSGGEIPTRGKYSKGLIDYEITEEGRNQGRDEWKDLHLEGQGVPQGTSFGPLLASTVLGRALRHQKALIYMDDGIIAIKNLESVEQTIMRLGTSLAKIGCELAEGKTNALGTYNLMKEGVKLLGTRWTQVRGLFNYSVKSETRKGISKPLINVNESDFRNVVERLYRAGLITPSKDSVMKRYLNIPRNADLLHDSLLDLATKHQIFGTILARAYSPESSVTEMAREINYGIFKAEAKLAKYPFSSIGSRLYRDNIARYISEEGKHCTTRITLQNVSTLSNDIFLTFLSKELPVRSKLIYNFYPRKVRKAVIKRIIKSGLKLR